MMMAETYSRRRAIAIFAAVAGLPLVSSAHASGSPVRWTGQALGAPATLVLNHVDKATAERLIERVVAEVARLENVFSLYRDDSALSELNRIGMLMAPSQDLMSLLQTSRRFWRLTGGAFDPTVQPLWALYRDHFAMPDANAFGPSREDLAQALVKIGFDGVRSDENRIVMRSGMALTLNGIAQGYITDRIVDMLRDEGVTSSLADMGEDRAIGSRADGTPWRIGVATSEDSGDPDAILSVVNRAVATSSATGFYFDPEKRFGHILDPRDGRAPTLYRRVTVIADEAAAADALSTAFALMDQSHIASVVERLPEVTVDLVQENGVHLRLGRTI